MNPMNEKNGFESMPQMLNWQPRRITSKQSPAFFSTELYRDLSLKELLDLSENFCLSDESALSNTTAALDPLTVSPCAESLIPKIPSKFVDRRPRLATCGGPIPFPRTNFFHKITGLLFPDPIKTRLEMFSSKERVTASWDEEIKDFCIEKVVGVSA